MFLRINKRVSVDNLNDSPAWMVDQLQELLASGVEARPDPKRRDFYEVEKCGQVFFIHTRPLSGRVMLLATWRTGRPMAELAGAV
jgi:hypothetical protein